MDLGGKEKRDVAIKVDLSYLEKTWGIKCKTHRVTGIDYGNKEVKFLLEFTKDVENLKELREAFTPVVPGGIRGVRSTWPLWFYFFDEDNVFVYKSPVNAIEGEVTGKKGDAIRVSVANIQPNDFNKTRKIEAQPGDKEKLPEKK